MAGGAHLHRDHSSFHGCDIRSKLAEPLLAIDLTSWPFGGDKNDTRRCCFDVMSLIEARCVSALSKTKKEGQVSSQRPVKSFSGESISITNILKNKSRLSISLHNAILYYFYDCESCP